MIKIFLLILFLFNIPLLARADNFDYSGNYARNFDFVGWVPEQAQYSWLGTSNGGDDWSADAQQFSVASGTHMTALNVNAKVGGVDALPTVSYSTPVTFELLSGGSYPHLGNSGLPVPGNDVLLKSAVLNFTAGSSDQSFQEIIPFDYQLEPQTMYWLVEIGKGDATVGLEEQCVWQNTAQTPEPPAAIFFLALAALIALKRPKQAF